MSSSALNGVATPYAGLLAAYLGRRSEHALITIVHLEGSKGGTLLTELDGHPLGSSKLEAVSAKVNDTDTGRAEFDEKENGSTWTLPAKALRAGLNPIEFVYPHTARPADFDANTTRTLAVRFSSVSLQSLR